MPLKKIVDSDSSDEIAPSLRFRMLRLIRAAQHISRAELSKRLNVTSADLSKEIKPLLAAKVLREDAKQITFAADDVYFIGVNIGVRSTQIGLSNLGGETSEVDSYPTPPNAKDALAFVRERIDQVLQENSGRRLTVIGVSVPGVTDPDRKTLIYAPHLKWRDVDIAKAFFVDQDVPVIVENDSTAAAMFEAQRRLRNGGDESDFIVVRSGTGIGVGLFINGLVFRGSGAGRGIAGEFGHMTIVAGGKPCVCGNRGCWEKYASAAAGATLYLGDRPPARGETVPRFVEIVSKAENGDNRARRTLEKIGDYLGIGIANVIMGTGIPKIIISGRLVHGWKFIQQPMNDAINRSIVGQIKGWSVSAGSPVGSAVGGALEVAADHYLQTL